MAAFPQASRAATPSRALAPARPPSFSTHTNKSLPDGSCNFRDLAFGINAPNCGCKRFWGDLSRPTDSAGQTEHSWCLCGHHACYHDTNDQAAGRPQAQSASRQLSRPSNLVQVEPGVYVEDRNQDPFFTPRRRGEYTRSLSGDTFVDDGQQSAPNFSAAADGQANVSRFLPNANSAASSSGLPGIPSGCQLNSSELRGPDILRSTGRNRAPTPGPSYQLPSKPSMFMQARESRWTPERTQETNPLTEWHRMVGQAREGSQAASTVQYSTDRENERPRNSPSRLFIEHVLQSRRAANQTAAVKTEDAGQSATELATSHASIRDTPDVEIYDRHIRDTLSLIDNTVREIQSVEETGASVDQGNETQQSLTQIVASQSSPRPTGNRTPPRSPRPSSNRMSVSQAESVASSEGNVPMALRKLAPRLLALQRHLAAQPNISMTLQNFSDRVWHLENASFGHIPAEEISDEFKMVDGRLLDVEYRLRELEEQFSAAEDRADARARRPIARDGSFDSAIADSPMALIAAALGDTEKEARLSVIEQRLGDLESAVPSYANPWEIEVVLFPWGRDLKGIWCSEDDLKHNYRSISDMSHVSTDLSQTFRKRSPRSSVQEPNAGHNGWSNKAISEWANSTEGSAEPLFPRSCGPKGKVWHRLKSRGLIKKVTIQEPGARHILDAIENAFGSNLLDKLGDHSELIDNSQMTDDSSAAPPFSLIQGLRSPVIPLRKIRRDHQLQFLPPSELTTPTLWTSEFLSSGVMMDVPGGKKRLYATVKCAYMQLHDEDSEWSWGQVKDLPRVPMHPDSSEAAQVPEVVAEAEAEAAEPFWNFDPKYDQPYSQTSSFGAAVTGEADNGSQSSDSTVNLGQLALRIGSEKRANTQPITKPSRWTDGQPERVRPPRRLKRTRSVPTTLDGFVTSPDFPAQITSKRRADGSLDEILDTLPSYSDATKNDPKRKRRRMNRSPVEETTQQSKRSASDAGRSASDAGDAQEAAFGFTPEPSVDQTSAYRDVADESSQGADAAPARPNVNRVANGNHHSGTNTPQAYDTPYSGPVGTERHWPPDGGTLSDTEPNSESDDEKARNHGDNKSDDREMTDAHEDDDDKDAEDSEWGGVSDSNGEENPLPLVKREDDGDVDRNLYGDQHSHFLHPGPYRWEFAHEEEGNNDAGVEYYGIRLTGKKHFG